MSIALHIRKSNITFCFIFGALYILIWTTGHSCAEERFDPCCSFPCQNNGICMTTGFDSYVCDCTATGYHGTHCQEAPFLRQFLLWLRPQKEAQQYILTHYSWIWAIINRVSALQRLIMKYVYMSREALVDTPPKYTFAHEYVTLEASLNKSYFSMSLPPVPRNCPTPMGVAGKKQLPDVDELVEKFFRRSRFIPDPYRSNVFFASYAQHFTHQFFRTDLKQGPGYTLGGDGVDASHIYGWDINAQNLLRAFKDGKMKTQVINDEEYPPYLRDVPNMPNAYPPSTPEDQKFAMGHPFYALLPGLFAFSTIWIREHNRVCGILKQEHPEWDDERLFQTAKMIIIGETIKITIEDYVQHLSQYHFKLTFDPELTHGTSFQYSNSIRMEFNHLYHWHPLFPDFHNVSNHHYTIEKVLYRVETVLKHGLTQFIDSMVRQRAGKLSHHNHGKMLLPVMKKAILHGRSARLQSFNNYRKRFDMLPYETFQELTGETEMASQLEEMYGSIDAVEFIVGLFVEKDGYTVTPKTMVEIGGPYSVKGLLANPICSPVLWRPSTFGGDVGFDIIKTASIEKLICLNVKGPCPRVAFTVPNEAMDYSHELPKEEL